MHKLKSFDKKQKVTFGLFFLILTLTIGAIDILTGYELTLSFFYLIPIIGMAYIVGQGASIFIAAFSAIIWTVSNKLLGKPYSGIAVFYWNMAIRVCMFTFFAIIASRLKQSFKREMISARRDFVTEIANSNAFYERLNLEINRLARYKRPLTIAYADCDNFKYINDKFGHKEGDRILKLIAGIIHGNIRLVDMVARVGGDEFAILLPETHSEAAQLVINRVKEKILYSMKEEKYSTSISIGVATFNRPLDNPDEMVKKADNLMYSAKKEGINNIRYENF